MTVAKTVALFVDQRVVAEVQRLLPDVYVAPIGSAVTGRRFESIMVTRLLSDSVTERSHFDAWAGHLACRLPPGKQVVLL